MTIMTYVIISIILNTISDLSIPVLSVIKNLQFRFPYVIVNEFQRDLSLTNQYGTRTSKQIL